MKVSLLDLERNPADEMLWSVFIAMWKAIATHNWLTTHPEEVTAIAVIALFKAEALDAAAVCTAELLRYR